MPDYICPKCQYIGSARRKKRGSIKMEVFAWLAFPLGIPYTLWRMATTFPVCRHCGHDMLLDADSAVGRRLMAMDAGYPHPAAMPEKPAVEQPSPKPKPPRDPDAW